MIIITNKYLEGVAHGPEQGDVEGAAPEVEDEDGLRLSLQAYG